jgi:hypothetical protein
MSTLPYLGRNNPGLLKIPIELMTPTGPVYSKFDTSSSNAITFPLAIIGKVHKHFLIVAT